MDGQKNYHKVKLDNERQTSYDINCMRNLKKKRIQMKLFAKQKQTQTLKTLWLPKGTGEGVGGMDQGFGMGVRTGRYIE